jgi:hypothetical protein
MSLLYPGIKINSGIKLKPNGSVGLELAPAGIVIDFSQISNGQVEDGSFSFGSVAINSSASGVAIEVFDTRVDGYFNIHSHNYGYIWTAQWSTGSTTMVTPVAMYYGDFGPNISVFYVLDPADPTYQTGLAGTFNFPVRFTAGSMPTSVAP